MTQETGSRLATLRLKCNHVIVTNKTMISIGVKKGQQEYCPEGCGLQGISQVESRSSWLFMKFCDHIVETETEDAHECGKPVESELRAGIVRKERCNKHILEFAALCMEVSGWTANEGEIIIKAIPRK